MINPWTTLQKHILCFGSRMKLPTYLFSFLQLLNCAQAAIVIDFDSLPTAPQPGFYNGDPSLVASDPRRANYETLGTQTNQFGTTDVLQRWTTAGVQFGNTFTPDFFSWSGWSWSSVQDAATPGFGNQYAAFPGNGANSVNTTAHDGYAVGFGDGAYLNIPQGMLLQSVDIANTTYAAISMRDGDAFAKKFQAGDYLRVTLKGYDQVGATGNLIASQTISLAEGSQVLANWLQVDIQSSLATARSIGLSFDSSDKSGGGFINTPTYVAIDNLSLTAVPEPSGFCLLAFAACGICSVRRRRRSRAMSRAGLVGNAGMDIILEVRNYS